MTLSPGHSPRARRRSLGAVLGQAAHGCSQTLAAFAGKHWRRGEGREEPLDDQKAPAQQERRQLPLCLRGEESRKRVSTMRKGPVGRSCRGRTGSIMPRGKG